ncbi:11355_t:CDS:1, partial [Gigaspora margarita]
MSIKNRFLDLLSLLLLALIFLTSLIIGTLIFASSILILNMIPIPPILLFSGLVVEFSVLFTSTIYKSESICSDKDQISTNEDSYRRSSDYINEIDEIDDKSPNNDQAESIKFATSKNNYKFFEIKQGIISLRNKTKNDDNLNNILYPDEKENLIEPFNYSLKKSQNKLCNSHINNDESETENKSYPLEINDEQFRFISQNENFYDKKCVEEYFEEFNEYHERLTYRTTINEGGKINEKNIDDQINILRKSCSDEYDSLSCNLNVIRGDTNEPFDNHSQKDNK